MPGSCSIGIRDSCSSFDVAKCSYIYFPIRCWDGYNVRISRHSKVNMRAALTSDLLPAEALQDSDDFAWSVSFRHVG